MKTTRKGEDKLKSHWKRVFVSGGFFLFKDMEYQEMHKKIGEGCFYG